MKSKTQQYLICSPRFTSKQPTPKDIPNFCGFHHVESFTSKPHNPTWLAFPHIFHLSYLSYPYKMIDLVLKSQTPSQFPSRLAPCWPTPSAIPSRSFVVASPVVPGPVRPVSVAYLRVWAGEIYQNGHTGYNG